MAERGEDFFKDPANLRKIPQNFDINPDFEGSTIVDFDPSLVGNFNEFLTKGKETANQLRTLGEAFEIWKETLRDNKNVIYLGLSGDMVTAGMAPVIRTMIEKGYIDGIFSQGANLFHDTATTLGYRRRQTTPQKYPDTELFSRGAVRMYDTLEATESQVFTPLMMAHLAKELTGDGPKVLNTRQLYYHIGRFLVENGLEKVPGILTTAYRHNVPVWVAGAESSVLMMDLAAAVNKGKFPIEVGITKDLLDHASVQDRLESLGYRTSLVEIGGGASSVPMVEHNPHHSHGSQGENLSWGKFDPEGRRTTVYMDATVALPMLVLGLLQSREVSDIMSRRKPLKFSNLSGEQLQIQKPN